MRNRFIGSILGSVLAMVVLLFPPVTLAQAVQPPASTPDLSGVWIGQTRHFNLKETPPMQPWAEEKYKAVREGLGPTGKGRNDLDPAIRDCVPHGFPRILNNPEPMEIIPIPGRVLMIFEWDHWVRQIWMDGREHPEDPDPTWMGHSIGWWEGNTLVVDTIGLNDKTWIDAPGHPHTEELHVVERYRRVDRNTLEVDLTFDDPKAYTEPWKGQFVFKLEPDWEIVESVFCVDRERVATH